MTAMTGVNGRHARFRELAATALDFPLTTAEAAELAAHLATCGACARLAGGLRFDAAALRRPAELATSYRLDTAVGAAIAGRPAPGQASRTLLLVAATALLAAALLGAAAVGAYLWRTLNPPLVVDPSPPITNASPAPSGEPGPAAIELTPSVVFSDFESADLSSLVVGPDGLQYVLDRAGASVYRIDVAANRAVPVYRTGERVGGTSTGAPRHLAVAAQDVLVLDDANRLWRWRPGESVAERRLAAVQVAEAAAWGTDVLGLATYVRDAQMGLYNLYVVDPSERQVLRYAPAADGSGFPAAATAYLEPSRDLTQATALYVDGDVYLAVGGSLVRFENGREAAGWPAPEPGGASRDYRLLASPDGRREGYVYAYDAAGQAVVAIAKGDGLIVAEYRLPTNATFEWRDLRGISVTADDTGARQLWWIDGARLLRAPLPVTSPDGRPPSSVPTANPGGPGLEPGELRVVSVGTSGVPVMVLGERPPALDGDGSVVAFEQGSPGSGSMVMVHDLSSTTTVIANVKPDGAVAADTAWRPSLSADGRFLAFDSWSSDLVEGDANEAQDVFVRDLLDGTTIRVSVAEDGGEATAGAWLATLSSDGSTVAFASSSPDLVPGDTNRRSDIFVGDLRSGEVRRVSVATDGTQANGESTQPAISADGRIVAFYSAATNLVPGDANDRVDLFVHDRATGATTRVSVASDGTEGDGHAGPATSCVVGSEGNPACAPGEPPALSGDGRLVAFASEAANLVPEDDNAVADVFLHDRATGATTLLSRRPDGTQADAMSHQPAISADGAIVAFTTGATNLGELDTNGEAEVFVVAPATGVLVRVSSNAAGEAVGGSYPGLSRDGRVVAFLTTSPELVPGSASPGIVATLTPLPGR